MPDAPIGADLTKHAPDGSYSPKFWYRDERFKCSDGGKVEIWAAQERQWWFEGTKGNTSQQPPVPRLSASPSK
jgi:hypothetical protein